MSLQSVTLQLEWPAFEGLELETIAAGALVLQAEAVRRIAHKRNLSAECKAAADKLFWRRITELLEVQCWEVWS